MTPQELLARRSMPLRLVIFDCDGVIVDSETIANRVTAAAITRIGWPMTPAESEHHFLGLTMADMVTIITDRIGGPIPPGWRESLMADFLAALASEATPIEGAIEALHAVAALGLPWRIASNSSHEEMATKFARIGIADLVAGRIHSHRDVARGKPAPDLFLATAAAEGVAPGECIVIEDSVPGATAAAAAGMDCLGYAPHGDGARLRSVGAVPFHAMSQLATFLPLALRISA